MSTRRPEPASPSAFPEDNGPGLATIGPVPAPPILPRALISLTLAHGLVDAFGATIQPLWPDLQKGMSLDDGSIQWAYAAWSLATSATQLLFGYWGDRAGGRWLLWMGPAIAVPCMSCLGLVDSFAMLCMLLILGGVGIAAFHPEAAARAAACAPHDRSRAMSVFAVGGYLGQAAGPVYSGIVSAHFGLRALAWSMTWGLAGLVLLGPSLRRRPSEEAPTPSVGQAALSPGAVRGRGKSATIALLLMIGTLRSLPALGVPLALAYSLKAQGGSNETIGVYQSIFLGGIGLGSLGCAAFVRRAVERRVLWLLPLLVAPLLAICPSAGSGLLLVGVGAVGLLLGFAMPVLISYGQQLLPRSQRVASSITMGVTWGLAGLFVAGTMTILNHLHRPVLAFHVFAASSVLSSVLCRWLPVPETRNSH